VDVAGYAADLRSPSGSGLNERDIQIYLDDTADPAHLLNYAEAGHDSPTAAATLGPQFARVGFQAVWETCSFPAKTYSLIVWVSSLVTPGARNLTSTDVEVAPCSPGTLLYQDEFASEPGGSYVLRLDQPGSRFWGIPPVFADFAAGIDARCTQASADCRYGLQFRERPGPGGTRTNSNYAVVVDPTDRTFWLEYWPVGEDPNRGILLVPPTPAAAIQPGTATNRVAVLAQGNALQVFVNGQQVGEARDERRPWGQLAWFAQTRASGAPVLVQFDNLLVTSPGPIETLASVLRGSP
jgi:hypothetical protein